MLPLRRSAALLSRRATPTFHPTARRTLTTTLKRRSDDDETHGIRPQIPAGPQTGRNMDKRLEDIRSEADLLPEGAAPGTVPTDLEQATGLERFEILGKMEGVDVFDMRPLPSDRVGTLEDPIMVKSFGEEQYCGCTGCPADSHWTIWLTLSRQRPLGRCKECGSCYMMEYVGPPDPPHDEHGHDEHHHHHKVHKDPETFADYIKPEYYYR